MPGLKIALLTPDAERFRGALTLAAAHVALGRPATLFLQLDAVRLLAPPVTAPQDATHIAAGLPGLARLLEDSLSLGVSLLACQSGLALAGLDLATLDARIAATGPLAFLQGLEPDDRLIIV
ncbi:peroxiredoxin [Sphingobium aquiterrae]|uniref:peroxiredoxin n=1 Tax=Sphingobium aquiterrae TaxID=2038656 RepID=UPI00301A3DC5